MFRIFMTIGLSISLTSAVQAQSETSEDTTDSDRAAAQEALAQLRAQAHPPVSEEVVQTSYEAAALMRQHASEIAEIWPGFWSPDEEFVLTRQPDMALYFGDRNPGENYVLVEDEGLDPSLSGQVYRHQTMPDELIDSGSLGAVDVNGKLTQEMMMQREDPIEAVGFIIHELFHFYQSDHAGYYTKRGFAEGFGDTLNVFATRPMVDPELLTPEFVAFALVERLLLKDAVTANSWEEAESFLQDYRLIRDYRTAEPEHRFEYIDVRGFEERYERIEGAATFVGTNAMSIVSGLDDRGLSFLLDPERHLISGPLREPSPFPTPDSYLMRFRMYGTGAAMLYLVDAYGQENWRELVELGVTPYTLISEMVSPSPEGELESILRRYDYGTLLAEAQASAASAAEQD